MDLIAISVLKWGVVQIQPIRPLNIKLSCCHKSQHQTLCVITIFWGKKSPAGKLWVGLGGQFLCGTQPPPWLQPPAASTPDQSAAPALRTHLAPLDAPQCQTSITQLNKKAAVLSTTEESHYALSQSLSLEGAHWHESVSSSGQSLPCCGKG